MQWATLCDLTELVEGEGRPVDIGGRRLAVFLYKGAPYATEDVCPHAGGDMAGGWVDDTGCAVCPWHGWSFKLTDGRMKGTGGDGLRTYTTRIIDHEGKRLVQADLRLP